MPFDQRKRLVPTTMHIQNSFLPCNFQFAEIRQGRSGPLLIHSAYFASLVKSVRAAVAAMANNENLVPDPLRPRVPTPMAPLSPGNRPALARQRDHSTCIQAPVLVHRPKSRGGTKPPSIVAADIPPPCMHHAETKQLFSKLRDGSNSLVRRLSGRSPMGASDSTSSRHGSFEVSSRESIEAVPTFPYISLRISVDREALNCNAAADVWVVIEATVEAEGGEMPGNINRFIIRSLRFCYKPIDDCRILEIVGQSSIRDLRLGQSSEIFLKVRIPKMKSPPRKEHYYDWTIDELTEDLETTLGAHEMEFLQVEVKYRYPQVPSDNVMSVKDVCKIKRLKTDSIWSFAGTCAGDITAVDSQVDMQAKLADYKTTAQQVQRQSSVSTEQRTSSETRPTRGSRSQLELSQPSVVISEVDCNTGSYVADERHCYWTTMIDKLSTADSARELWHHLKRKSLSSQQLLEIQSPEKVEQLEASDKSLRIRRQQALANKRSVGAETLKAWKWEENIKMQKDRSEMPWL